MHQAGTRRVLVPGQVQHAAAGFVVEKLDRRTVDPGTRAQQFETLLKGSRIAGAEQTVDGAFAVVDQPPDLGGRDLEQARQGRNHGLTAETRDQLTGERHAIQCLIHAQPPAADPS